MLANVVACYHCKGRRWRCAVRIGGHDLHVTSYEQQRKINVIFRGHYCSIIIKNNIIFICLAQSEVATK